MTGRGEGLDWVLSVRSSSIKRVAMAYWLFISLVLVHRRTAVCASYDNNTWENGSYKCPVADGRGPHPGVHKDSRLWCQKYLRHISLKLSICYIWLHKSTGITSLFISLVNIKIALEFGVQVKDPCGGDGDHRAPTDSECEGSRDIFLSFNVIDRILYL